MFTSYSQHIAQIRSVVFYVHFLQPDIAQIRNVVQRGIVSGVVRWELYFRSIKTTRWCLRARNSPYMRSILSVRNFPSDALETVPVCVCLVDEALLVL